MIIALIPAYNEEKTVYTIVRECLRYVDEAVVINDASFDNTAEMAKKAGAKVINHDVNKGLGYAIRTGLEYAKKRKPAIVITIDADGQHEPEDIPRFIGKINEGYDFVLGSRNLRKYPFIKKIGNFFLNKFTNFISGTNLKDTESGFRAFRGSILPRFYLISDRYQIATEIVFEVGRNNLKAANIPIKSPIYVKGVRVRDGIQSFIFLMRRKDRTMLSYIEDLKYVLKKYL
ncbi:MAG: glycosyltransferase family 2 protein [Candidatus Aenigmarchaeota archaeon]|nr:glycosyltransferase family 2 protein [Candidatus Aenigmarchaeota archaeon]